MQPTTPTTTARRRKRRCSSSGGGGTATTAAAAAREEVQLPSAGSSPSSCSSFFGRWRRLLALAIATTTTATRASATARWGCEAAFLLPSGGGSNRLWRRQGPPAGEGGNNNLPRTWGGGTTRIVPSPLPRCYYSSSPRQQREESSSASVSESAQRQLERTKAHLEKLRNHSGDVLGADSSSAFLDRNFDDDEGDDASLSSPPPDPLGAHRERLYRGYLMRSANSLKEELANRGLAVRGRKPDLARRLAEHDVRTEYGSDDDNAGTGKEEGEEGKEGRPARAVPVFAGIPLSSTAAAALGRAGFTSPSPIQKVALPMLSERKSALLHAETGSGKTLAYLLPISERLWWRSAGRSRNDARSNNIGDDSDSESANLEYAVILTPTRELAAQVAGVASALAPPGSVRLLSRPANLMGDDLKERGELDTGGYGLEDGDEDGTTRQQRHPAQIFVGSAKAVMHSLYGDGRMPAPPTPKPLAMAFLKRVRCLVLDEVDRLLDSAGGGGGGGKRRRHVHEKPAAIVTAAVARQSLGRAQIVAASATVGRPLRRELARVLGLSPQESPPIVRAADEDDSRPSVNGGAESSSSSSSSSSSRQHQQTGRAVTIPDGVEHYVVSMESPTDGQLLTGAHQVVQALVSSNERKKAKKILLVLTRGFGIHARNAIGALRHFGCRPEPVSLLDALQAGDAGEGTDALMEQHRQVSGASGVGETDTSNNINNDADEDDGYLLVTGEDTVRGLHLDGLDVVLVVGKANGPDEYTHIAGRTGRAGRPGKVINIVRSQDHAASLQSWEQMLECQFTRVTVEQIKDLE